MSWADFIRDDLRAKIGQTNSFTQSLSLHALSKQYGVSTTPVRAAVDDLLAERFLLRKENGRLEVNREKIGSLVGGKENKVPRPPRDHREEIAQDLFQQSLKGKAEFVREEQTAQRYDVSTVVVREVFHRLAGQGVLKHLPRRGWQLRAFRRKDLDDYLRVREQMELVALSQAWPNLDDNRLKAIFDGNQLPESDDQWPVIDNSLHDYIVDTSDNFYVRDFFDRCGKFFMTLFAWDLHDRESALETVQQHREILAAMLCRDKRSVERSLAHHIRTNYAILKQIEKMENEGADDGDSLLE